MPLSEALIMFFTRTFSPDICKGNFWTKTDMHIFEGLSLKPYWEFASKWFPILLNEVLLPRLMGPGERARTRCSSARRSSMRYASCLG